MVEAVPSDIAVRYVDLSREELAFVMERLGIAELIGLEGGPLVLVPEDERPAAVAAGSRALIARGLVQRLPGAPDPRWGLSQLLIAAVGTCATALDYLSITRRSKDVPLMAWYAHLMPKLSVLHTLAEAGVHRFYLCRQPGDLQSMLAAIVGDHDAGLAQENALIVETDALDAAARLVVAEPERALDVLLATDLDQAEATRVVSLLKASTSNTMLTRAHHCEPEPELVDVFGVTNTPEGNWLVQAASGEPGKVTIRPVSPAELDSRLCHMLQLGQG